MADYGEMGQSGWYFDINRIRQNLSYKSDIGKLCHGFPFVFFGKGKILFFSKDGKEVYQREYKKDELIDFVLGRKDLEWLMSLEGKNCPELTEEIEKVFRRTEILQKYADMIGVAWSYLRGIHEARYKDYSVTNHPEWPNLVIELQELE